jgi:hypothetical protein
MPEGHWRPLGRGSGYVFTDGAGYVFRRDGFRQVMLAQQEQARHHSREAQLAWKQVAAVL